ncbi:hypothetical protein D9M68_284810 [compost metagenome]
MPDFTVHDPRQMARIAEKTFAGRNAGDGTLSDNRQRNKGEQKLDTPENEN